MDGALQAGHNLRTRRCASTPSNDEASRNGSTPMSVRRVTADTESLVCSVASTRWPVSEACTAICAVSRSRISPIMITSGSWRRMARRASAKLMSILALTCVWLMPDRSYSMGSSTVRMLLVAASRRLSAAYSVVVLPLPVGPVTSTMPCGWRIRRSSCVSTSGHMPRRSNCSRPASLSNKRSTARSPWPVGKVDTRTSMGRPPTRSAMRPSCGRRFSAMSRCAMILMREIKAACKALRGDTTSRSVPSTR
ncbi:hypothetical protein D3C72_884640 [compost metagenome]